MNSDQPFIYLGALRRSGSKVVARALTRWPDSYVFLELGLAIPTMRTKPEAVELLEAIGFDLPRLAGDVRSTPPERRPSEIVAKILAPLRSKVPIVGVKEIRHAFADQALDAMGGQTRVVVLVRDPRGILDSLRRKEHWRTRPIEFAGGLTPASLADHLHDQFTAQRRMLETRKAIALRYEDLCSEPDRIRVVREFCGLPADLDADLARLDGHEPGAHGDRIGSETTHEWQHDVERAPEARELYERLTEHCRYWGYEESGERTARPPGPPPAAVEPFHRDSGSPPLQ